MVIAEFNLDTSSAIAAQDVRDKIAPVTAQFRDEIDTPIVQRYDPLLAQSCQSYLNQTA